MSTTAPVDCSRRARLHHRSSWIDERLPTRPVAKFARHFVSGLGASSGRLLRRVAVVVELNAIFHASFDPARRSPPHPRYSRRLRSCPPTTRFPRSPIGEPRPCRSASDRRAIGALGPAGGCCLAQNAGCSRQGRHHAVSAFRISERSAANRDHPPQSRRRPRSRRPVSLRCRARLQRTSHGSRDRHRFARRRQR